MGTRFRILVGVLAVVSIAVATVIWQAWANDQNRNDMRSAKPASTNTSSQARPAARTPATPPLDLSEIDWRNATIPADLCDSSGWTAMHDGEANIPDPSGGNFIYGLTEDKPVYGDLTADGNNEVGLKVFCVPEGAGGAAVFSQGFLILDGSTGKIQLTGTVTAAYQSGSSSAAPIVNTITISPRKIIANELFYVDLDPTCCPSGSATTTWTYTDGTLRPDQTSVN
jgi:hypothetical protein